MCVRESERETERERKIEMILSAAVWCTDSPGVTVNQQWWVDSVAIISEVRVCPD